MALRDSTKSKPEAANPPAPRTAPEQRQPSGGGRLPAVGRERRPGLAVLAALLILAGGLGATVLVQKAGEKVSAVKITERVAPGQHIPETAIEEIQVAADTPVNFVRWDQRQQLGQLFTASEVAKGTLLTGDMLTQKTGVSTDQAVVGLALKAGQFPPGLRDGDKVRVMWVGRDAAKLPTGTATATPGTPGPGAELASGTVRQVFKNDSAASTSLSLSVLVPTDKSGAIAQASSAGEVALVLLSAPQ
ncbi:hypothetical protein AB0K51_18980 [Kitasatospora sp. NPDC049285]|uniref:hypothetical protein n=1 Tax=Kitasatospora sp. NPDC049285 TaxID=3157096 RepID=UPI003426C453